MNLLFFVLITALVIGLIPFNYQTYQMLQIYKKNKPADYEFPEMADFKLTAIWTVFFILCELICKNYLYIVFIPHCKIQVDPDTGSLSAEMSELRVVKCKKMAHCFYKSLYFIVAVAWGYYIIINEPYFPRSLGGKGDFSKSFDGYPYTKHSPGFKEILLWTSAYHFGGMITHLLGPRKNDFLEMGLHHLCAIYLYGGCYIINGWEVGQTIALLHDLADIMVGFTKCAVESKYKIASYVTFLSVMLIWFYTRVCLLPTMIYYIWHCNVMVEFPYVKYFFCVLLLCMWLLHCHWFRMFCVMLHTAVTKDKIEDEQSKAEVHPTSSKGTKQE